MYSEFLGLDPISVLEKSLNIHETILFPAKQEKYSYLIRLLNGLNMEIRGGRVLPTLGAEGMC